MGQKRGKQGKLALGSFTFVGWFFALASVTFPVPMVVSDPFSTDMDPQPVNPQHYKLYGVHRPLREAIPSGMDFYSDALVAGIWRRFGRSTCTPRPSTSISTSMPQWSGQCILKWPNGTLPLQIKSL